MKLDVLGTVLCAQCPAACCRYVALPIDRPRTLRDYDDIRWYLMHEGFSVFVEDGDWYVQVQARCRNLGEDNLCCVYETRPRLCREYEPGECDYSAAAYDYDELFTHPAQLEAYVRRRLGREIALADGIHASDVSSSMRRNGQAGRSVNPEWRKKETHLTRPTGRRRPRGH